MWSNYLFALYIFVLLALLIYIWAKAKKSKVDDRIDALEEKQKELVMMQNEAKETMMVLETYMYEAKENLGNERAKIEILIKKFESMLDQRQAIEERVAAAAEIAVANQVADKVAAEVSESEDVEDTEIDKDKLYAEVSKMNKAGFSLDEIVRELGISKGEANFILGISK